MRLMRYYAVEQKKKIQLDMHFNTTDSTKKRNYESVTRGLKRFTNFNRQHGVPLKWNKSNI